MVAGGIDAGFVVCFVLGGSFKVVLRTAGVFCFVLFLRVRESASVSLYLGVLWGDEAWNECCEIRSVAGLKISWVSPAGRLKTYHREGLGSRSFRKGMEGY